MWATTFLSLSIAHINSSSIKSWPSPGNTRDTTHSIPTSINTTSKQSKIPFTSPSKNHLYSPEQNRSTTQIMSTSFPPANNTTPPNYSIQAIPTAFIFSLLPHLYGTTRLMFATKNQFSKAMYVKLISHKTRSSVHHDQTTKLTKPPSLHHEQATHQPRNLEIQTPRRNLEAPSPSTRRSFEQHGSVPSFRSGNGKPFPSAWFLISSIVPHGIHPHPADSLPSHRYHEICRLRDQLRTNTPIAARRQHLPPPSLGHEQRRTVILHRSHAVHGVVSERQEREWAGVCKDWSVRLEYSDPDLGTVESWRSGNCCWERDLG